MVNQRAAREGSSSLSIPHYPSCSERRAQLGTGYWLGIHRTPRKLKIAGYREAPQFDINPFPKETDIVCCYLPLPVEGEGSRYPLFKVK